MGFRNDDSPEDAQIADCREPKPIHYEVDRAAEQNEAGREKDEHNQEREKGASPPCGLNRSAIFLVRPVSLMLILLRC